MAIQFNLLPWREERRAKKAKLNKTVLVVAVILGVVVGLGYYGWEKVRLDDHNQALNHITQKNKSLEPKLREKRELDKLKETLNQQIDAIEALQADRASVTHMLEELSAANSQELFLTEFSLQDGKVNITGIAENDSQISDLMKRLRASQWYQEPQLLEIVSMPKQGEEVKRFRISSNLLLPGSDIEKGGQNG